MTEWYQSVMASVNDLETVWRVSGEAGEREKRAGREATMVVLATEIAAWLDSELLAEQYRAEEPENGLLVDSGRPVVCIASAVNTTFETIAAASAAAADLLIVHHPSWPYIDLGLHQRKLDALMAAGVSLYGAHLSSTAPRTVRAWHWPA